MSKHSNPTEQAMSEQELFSKVLDMLPITSDGAMSGEDYTAVLLRFAKAKARLRCNLHASLLGTTINFNKSPF